MHSFDTPIGTVWLDADADGLRSLAFHGSAGAHSEEPLLAEAEAQLLAYFAGGLRSFDLPLATHGTEFQERVWSAVSAIQYGATTTYSALAAALGRPSAWRAVGAANGRNPLPIIVPCHRVVGAAGSLTGYGGGLERKRALLDLEAAAG
jgi:methylated-DNA-[protein]-cysteine S-methyltransferase